MAGCQRGHQYFSSVGLLHHWGGNPSNLFSEEPAYEQLYAIMRNGIGRGPFNLTHPEGFLGFSEKMVLMLAFYLMDNGLIGYYHLPVPVDFHVMRILTSHHILRVHGAQFGDNLNSAEYRRKARKVTLEYCRQHDVSSLRLCDCLWLLSRTGCRRHPDNISLRNKFRKEGGKIHPKPYSWSKYQVEKYTRTCGQCPIQEQCKFSVPSAPYYEKSSYIIRRKLRSKPPIELLEKNWRRANLARRLFISHVMMPIVLYFINSKHNMKGYFADIEEATINNTDFRHVLYTGKFSQLVAMSLKPGEEIGAEVHEDGDQFFRFESGTGQLVIDENTYEVKADDAGIVPAGANHNVINTGDTDLKLYTIYSPAEHRDGTVHATKAEAEADDEHFDGTTTE